MTKIPILSGSGHISLKYVVRDSDRHGNVRFYVRRPGSRNKVRLRKEPGTIAFIAEYDAVMNGPATPATRRSKTPGTDSLGWLCLQYYQSALFKFLDTRTRRVRRQILERFCDGADFPYRDLQARDLCKRRDAMLDRPEAANGLIKSLRQLFRFAIEYGLADANPASAVSYLRSGSQGHHTWTDEEIRAYEVRHPVGSAARLALGLLLYTAQRRSDVVLLGPRHVVDGNLVFTQQKNRNRSPVTLQLPILPEHQELFDATATGADTFLITKFGKPFTANGFGNWVRKRCDEASLPSHCTAHGLRKAAARRFAECGCTELEIMAWTGHQTSKEVGRYVKAASRSRLAANALSKIKPLQNPHGGGVTLMRDN